MQQRARELACACRLRPRRVRFQSLAADRALRPLSLELSLEPPAFLGRRKAAVCVPPIDDSGRTVRLAEDAAGDDRGRAALALAPLTPA
jgi:hypothetical protein